MIKYAFLFLFVLLQGIVFSQQIQVKDVSSGQGISNVLLFKKGKIVSVSDSLGIINGVCFKLSNVA